MTTFNMMNKTITLSCCCLCDACDFAAKYRTKYVVILHKHVEWQHRLLKSSLIICMMFIEQRFTFSGYSFLNGFMLWLFNITDHADHGMGCHLVNGC